jgi:hypothetical protein
MGAASQGERTWTGRRASAGKGALAGKGVSAGRRASARRITSLGNKSIVRAKSYVGRKIRQKDQIKGWKDKYFCIASRSIVQKRSTTPVYLLSIVLMI